MFLTFAEVVVHVLVLKYIPRAYALSIGPISVYVDLYVSDSCLMTKHASTAPPQTQYYILHLLNGCSTINSTTVRLLGLLSDFS